MKNVRKEVHTRSSFAFKEGQRYYKLMKHIVDSGNVFTSKNTKKFLQARRIYVHYCNEYQICQELPLTT